jgi:hypothetical protein
VPYSTSPGGLKQEDPVLAVEVILLTDLLRRLLDRVEPHSQVQTRSLHRAFTPDEQVGAPLRHANQLTVDLTIAGNPATGPRTLRRLAAARSAPFKVHARVAANPSASPGVLGLLDSDCLVNFVRYDFAAAHATTADQARAVLGLAVDWRGNLADLLTAARLSACQLSTCQRP